MKILGIIPARKNSKGIKNKNLKKLNGKPLIEYTIESAIKSKINHIIITSDIKSLSKYDDDKRVTFISRPEKLCKSNTEMNEVVDHTLKIVKKKFDIFVILQPTSPFRNYQHINQAIKIFSKDKKANSLVSVCEVPHNFNFEKLGKIDKGYLNCKTKIRNRQKIEKIYARNGAIYLARYEKYRGSLLISKIIPFIMNPKDSIDIDNMHDWEIAESILK